MNFNEIPLILIELNAFKGFKLSWVVVSVFLRGGLHITHVASKASITDGVVVGKDFSVVDNWADWKAHLKCGPIELFLHQMFPQAIMQPFSNAAWQEFVHRPLAAEEAPAVGTPPVVPGSLVNLGAAFAEASLQSDNVPDPMGSPLDDSD